MSTNLPPDDASVPSPGPAPTGTSTGAAGHRPGPQPGPAGPPQQPGAEFFDKIRSTGLVRPDEGRWGAGVCTGIARRTGLDPILVRGLFVVLAIFGGGALLLYGLGWLLMPHPDGRIHAQEVMRGVFTAGFFGAAAAVLFGLPFDATFDAGRDGTVFGWGWGWGPGGLGLLIGIAVVVWAVRSRGQHGAGGPGPGGPGGAPSAPTPPSWGTPGTPPRPTGTDDGPADRWATSGSAPTAVPARPAPMPVPVPDLSRPSHALTRATVGLAVVVAAAVALVDRFAVAVPAVVAVSTAAALAAVALGILLAGLTGRRSGGLAPIAWLLAIVAVNAATLSNLDVDRRDATWRPASAAVAEAGYDHDAGDVLVDLTDPALLAGATSADPVDVNVDLGVGRLVVELPAGASARVDGSVGLGQLDDRAVGGDATGGSTSRTVIVGTGPATLVVRAGVGLGQLVIVPEGTDVALAPTTATEASR